MSFDIESQILKKLAKNVDQCKISLVRRENPEYFNLKNTQEYVRHRLTSMRDSFLELLRLEEFLPINHVSIKPFYTFGMVTSLTGEKLEDDVYICNTEDGSNVLMKLNLEGLRKYSLFNGLIVAIKARNLKGNELLVEDIYSLPLITTNNELKGPLKIIVAHGAFTENTLDELLSYRSDILILFGPFCNFKNGSFADFEIFVNLLETKLCKNITQKVMLVPSLEDNNFVKVFPQISGSLGFKNILLLDNPSYFYANNHLIAVSNFDVLFDLSKNEYFKEIKEEIDPLFSVNRSSRLAYLVVFQKSFAPVFPSTFNVAYGKCLDMQIAPDVFITASKLKYFIGDINPVTFLNIGSLSTNYHTISTLKDNTSQYDIQLNKKYKN